MQTCFVHILEAKYEKTTAQEKERERKIKRRIHSHSEYRQCQSNPPTRASSQHLMVIGCGNGHRKNCKRQPTSKIKLTYMSNWSERKEKELTNQISNKCRCLSAYYCCCCCCYSISAAACSFPFVFLSVCNSKINRIIYILFRVGISNTIHQTEAYIEKRRGLNT